jgi:hypothetical protein
MSQLFFRIIFFPVVDNGDPHPLGFTQQRRNPVDVTGGLPIYTTAGIIAPLIQNAK